MTLDLLLAWIQQNLVELPAALKVHWPADGPERPAGAAEPLSRTQQAALGIDVCVQRLPLGGLQVMDPRRVRIAPGARNACTAMLTRRSLWCFRVKVRSA